MVRVEIDLVRDLFTVQTSGGSPDAAAMVAAIEELGFTATCMTGEEEAPEAKKPAKPQDGPLPRFLRDALRRAGSEGKLVVLDFSAEWCAPCKQMLDETYGDPQVAELLERDHVFLVIDTDAEPALARRFGVDGIPDARVLDSTGAQLQQITGFKTVDEMLALLAPPRCGSLGLGLSSLSRERAGELGLPVGDIRVRGLLVDRVVEDGPCTQAGIAAGDILRELGGNRLYSVDNVRDFLRVTGPGTKVEVQLFVKGGKDRSVEVTLGTGSPRPAGIDWQFASLEQLEDALDTARELGQSVLIGVSGAET